MSSNEKLRVLVVDDERANITLMADALKSDFKTVVAKSGSQALERAGSDSPPDIILLDILMPDMDGYEVCRILKADERTRHIPVIFVSAMSEVGDETKGLEIGAVDYITKPFNPAIVRARVRTHLESAMARAKISALLNNSGQGFLSFGRDLLVDEENSRECGKIFNIPIANQPINALLYPEDGPERHNFAANVARILSDPDSFKRDLYISLMPGEFLLNGKYLRAEYKVLGDDKLMLILTDITDQKKLEHGIRLERRRLKFIVSAVRETPDFFEILKDFDELDNKKLEALLGSGAPPRQILGELYRHVHTLKGLFQQINFIHLPPALHDLETRLSTLRQAERDLDMAAIRAVCNPSELRQARLRDLAVIEEALGADFLRQSCRIDITREQAFGLEALAKRLITRGDHGLDAEDVALLQELSVIRHISLKSLLNGYPKATRLLAERLGKAIYPFSVEGGDILVDPDRFSNFSKALIHVFRNALDHGIESPDERSVMGKDEVGTITCSIASRGSEIILTVSDDGRGVDADLLLARAVSLNLLDPEEALRLDDRTVLNMMFDEFFSTKENITDLSGRGVGLSAVKTALDELGGRVEIETDMGKGTTFRFILKTSP
ncbi:MAG: response regulator [Deltaproteobacteria bacterium]|nr:response regulator [Deltaproteobacteria bacterium]